ncbi:MAG: biopolymer transporter ExbD [Gemmatimonadetes bacterium]|nr:biopolymer transporter ExbD [Gemmatimonadota bacterium]|tara:strand:- start:162 stop:575 length:414 start_codon:yes stop_codon:yes gene_type:complete
MKFNRKAKVVAAVPTASMADISFLLLVFFMVTTVFVRYRGLPVRMPAAEKIEKLENRRIVTHIWIDGQGVIRIEEQDIGLDQVAKIMNRKMIQDPRTIVSIKADADAEFGLIADVLEELRKAEALRVNFATNQERDE